MTQYHVATGGLTGDIYAGRLDQKGRLWAARSKVTEEAVMAVADHVMKQYDGEMVARFTAPDGTRMRAEIVVSPDDPLPEANQPVDEGQARIAEARTEATVKNIEAALGDTP